MLLIEREVIWVVFLPCDHIPDKQRKGKIIYFSLCFDGIQSTVVGESWMRGLPWQQEHAAVTFHLLAS